MEISVPITTLAISVLRPREIEFARMLVPKVAMNVNTIINVKITYSLDLDFIFVIPRIPSLSSLAKNVKVVEFQLLKACIKAVFWFKTLSETFRPRSLIPLEILSVRVFKSILGHRK
ncbi:MAG: hypothetical protein ACTSYM_13765, partial [Candidatus Baldrarchaeia archaeon]